MLFLVFISCSSGQNKGDETSGTNLNNTDTIAKGAIVYVEVNDPLEDRLILEGKAIFDAQCSNCHYLDTATLNGPGWAGISNRRDPNWIMNMILNVDMMNEVDSVAHTLLKNSTMQMPDQGLSVDKARAILEFMRKNDLDQTSRKDEGVNN